MPHKDVVHPRVKRRRIKPAKNPTRERGRWQKHHPLLLTGNYGPARHCQWINAELPTPLGYREDMKCLAPSREGSSYCEEHHPRVWIKHKRVRHGRQIQAQ